jgi:exosortase
MLKLPSKDSIPTLSPSQWVSGGMLLVALGLSYGGTMVTLMGRWASEQDYIWCFLVVPFSIVVLWMRRGTAPELPLTGSLWGLALLAIPGAMRLAGAFIGYPWLDQISIAPCVASLVVLLAGWEGLLWAWPAVAYLVFMVPLPGRVAQMASEPLQRIGAVTSTYLLQTMGIPAQVQGTIIYLTQWPLNVEEACSGLRMLMLFLAVCTGAAIVSMRRDMWERVVLILSAPPIAVVANVIRITLTGLLYEEAGREWAEMLFHEFFGLLMMPLAIVLLWLEMIVLSMLVSSRQDEDWL